MWIFLNKLLLLLLLFGSLAAIFTGAGLLIVPDKLRQASLAASGPGKAALNGKRKTRNVERWFYRHHRISGAAIFSGALVILYVFLLTDTKQRIAAAISDDLVLLLDAAVAFFVIASVFAAQVGAAVYIRPSMLRSVEKEANRLVSFGLSFRVLMVCHHVFDNLTLRYRKAVALAFIAGGLYVCTMTGLMLYRHQVSFLLL
jgi:hypothetical protein